MNLQDIIQQIKDAVDSALYKCGLPSLGEMHAKSIIIAFVAAVVGIVALVLVLRILKKRKLKESITINLDDSEEPLAQKTQGNYDIIVRRIKGAGKKCKSILFASSEPAGLPVTVAVNTAVGLAKGKKSCLLIDLDLERDAVARAFELNIEESDVRPRAIQTELENLWVWPACYFARLKHMNIQEIVQKALDKFDIVVINAPALVTSCDRRQIISAADAAFICTKGTSDIAELSQLMEEMECRIIGHIQITSPKTDT
jgi:Mrp family chromosome partitioning ATPase